MQDTIIITIVLVVTGISGALNSMPTIRIALAPSVEVPEVIDKLRDVGVAVSSGATATQDGSRFGIIVVENDRDLPGAINILAKAGIRTLT